VLIEMGEPKGHVRQASLATLLARVAAAPWTSMPAEVCPSLRRIILRDAALHARRGDSGAIMCVCRMQTWHKVRATHLLLHHGGPTACWSTCGCMSSRRHQLPHHYGVLSMTVCGCHTSFISIDLLGWRPAVC
jgi:hypothetical protein